MIKAAETAEVQNAAYWATISNEIKLQKGLYSFKDREYLLEPMSSMFRRLCYIKSAQGGISTTEVAKSFHGMIFKRFPGGVLYLFPTTDDMHDYSKGIIGPFIAANPHSVKKWVKNVKGATDTDALKTVNRANLYMRGAGLTTIIEGEGYASKLQGITVDKVVFDEIELMDKAAIAKAVARMRDSKIKEEIYIGNPGIPGRGIDEIYHGSNDQRGSDQRHWFRKCLHCGEWTCAEESFPECVQTREDGTGYIGCVKCGKEVFVRDGEWVPKNRDNSDYMHGYQYSCLTSPNNDPAEILDNFLNPPQGNLADVYRLSLGKAYVSTEDQLRIGQVLSRCGPFIMSIKDPGPCSFGLDVGKIKHLVIGKRTGGKSYEIVKVARLSSWADIGNMVKRFNCKNGVIDEGPYYDEARRFQEAIRMRSFLCHYSDSYISTNYNLKTWMVNVHRTGAFDATHNLVAEEGLLVLPRICDEVREFAKQVCDPAKSLEVNKRTKESVYRYKGREDHYRNALNYFLLAAYKTGLAKSHSTYKKKQRTVNNDYARI